MYLGCSRLGLPAVLAYRGYTAVPAVPKVPAQALRACSAPGQGTLPLPCVLWRPAHLHMAAAIGEAAGIHEALRIKKRARCAMEQRRASAGAA